MTPRHAEANGIRIAHVTAGEAGPWVVLAHSLASSHAMWAPQIASLAAAGYRVLAFDARGHGGTDAPPPPYSIATMAEDMRALMDRLGIARAHMVGLSMGGAMVQHFAIAHPDRVASLVVVDATSAYPPAAHPMWRERAEAVAKGGVAAVAEGTLGRWFTPAWREANPAQLEEVRRMVLATPPQGFIGAVGGADRLRRRRPPRDGARADAGDVRRRGPGAAAAAFRAHRGADPRCALRDDPGGRAHRESGAAGALRRAAAALPAGG
jgi:3-oxoadipate enol-lactonase